jgi:hypothetical protein
VGETTIHELPFTDGDDPVADGDDTIQALAEKLDALLPRHGDLKPSMQLADHGPWLLCDGRTNLVRATYPTAFVNAMLAAGFNGDDGTKFGIPDFRGRAIVGKGTHGDVNALNDNEGAGVGGRTPKHVHRTPTGWVSNGGAGNFIALATDLLEVAGAAGGLLRHAGSWAGGSPDGNESWRGVSDAVGPAYGVANLFVFSGL